MAFGNTLGGSIVNQIQGEEVRQQQEDALAKIATMQRDSSPLAAKLVDIANSTSLSEAERAKLINVCSFSCQSNATTPWNFGVTRPLPEFQILP